MGVAISIFSKGKGIPLSDLMHIDPCYLHRIIGSDMQLGVKVHSDPTLYKRTS